jgi:hypothetical protein
MCDGVGGGAGGILAGAGKRARERSIHHLGFKDAAVVVVVASDARALS